MSKPYIPLNWLERELPDPAQQREYSRHRVVLAVTEAIAEAMEQRGLLRVDIADRLGKSKSHISQLLSGRRNMTLKTLGDVLWACDSELEDLRLAPLGEMLCSPDHAGEWSAFYEGAFKNRSQNVEVMVNVSAPHSPRPTMNAAAFDASGGLDVKPNVSVLASTVASESSANTDLAMAA